MFESILCTCVFVPERSGAADTTLVAIDTFKETTDHCIGITHRGRSGHWNSIDQAICRLASIQSLLHYKYRSLTDLLMLCESYNVKH